MYAVIGKDDFQFEKARHKRVTDLQLAPNLSFSYPVVTKMAGQGVLYIQLKEGLDFYYKSDSEDESEFCSQERMKKSFLQWLLRYLLPVKIFILIQI